MVALALKTTKPDFRALRVEGERIRKEHRRAAFEVTDLVTQKAHQRLQAKMRSVGLGKLDRAVGWTSAKRKRQLDRTPYGAIYAKGGDETLAGGALEAYSRGTTISAKNGKWLAVPTDAVPRLVVAGGKRRRLTPALWAAAGLNQKIGKLIFRQIRSDLALLVVRKVSLSPKTGQARALGKRPPRSRIVADGNTVVFVLIRQTKRAKRFDKDEVIRFYVNRIPDYMARTLAGYRRSAT